MAKKHKVIGQDGEACPRCGCPTEIREHTAVTEKHRRQPFYYTRWFNCTNLTCRTTLIMPKQFIVWNDNEAARRIRGMDDATAYRMEKIREQLTPWA